MRLADYFLITVLIALGLIITLAFSPKQPKTAEHFVGYQVYGGGGGIWAPPNGAGGSPQCTDKAIGFQEDTQDPGRHWGWENNATCAFYSIPKATNVAPAQPVAQPAPAPPGTQVAAFEQCGGKGGACATKGQCEDKAWNNVSCPQNAPVCSRVNEWHWQCDVSGAAPGPQPSGGGETQLQMWERCGGKAEGCGDKGPDQCVNAPWKGFKCPDGATCVADSEWWWKCAPKA